VVFTADDAIENAEQKKNTKGLSGNAPPTVNRKHGRKHASIAHAPMLPVIMAHENLATG